MARPSQPPTRPPVGQSWGGPVLLWSGVAVFVLCMGAGLFRSFAARQWLPPVGVEYATELDAFVRQHGKIEALPQFRMAAQIDFDNEWAVARLLESAREAGAEEDVLWALVALARLRPEDAKVRSDLAAALLRQGRAGEALQQATFAAWLAPDSSEAYCHLGAALLRLGDREQAAAAYRRALDLDPTSEAAQVALQISMQGF